MTLDRCLMAVTGVQNLGGGIAAANKLARSALLDVGYQVDVIALNEPSGGAIPHNATSNSYRGMANNKIAFATAVWTSVLRNRYRVVFCDHVNLAVVLVPLAISGLCRYVVRLNGIEVFQEELDWEGKLGLKFAHQRLAISEHTHQQVLKQYPGMDIQVCDLSLDPERSQRLQSARSTLAEMYLTSIAGTKQRINNQMILHVGRMSATEQYKGQDVLIRAMPSILAAFPDAQLVLVGKGDDTERLLALAKSHSETTQQSIFMTGFVSDGQLDQLYQGCCVFAMPSRGEGFGLVYLEAMSHAKPCIGSRLDSAGCIIRHEETGLLVDDPTDLHEVAERVITLLRHPDVALSMGIAGHQLVNDYYLFSHFRHRFLQTLTNCVN